MLLDITNFTRAARDGLLVQFTLAELFQELRGRANQDVEEDEEIDWEDELSDIHYRKLSRRFPHFFDKGEE